MRETPPRKKKYKITGEIVRVETAETPQGDIQVPVFIEKPKGTGKEPAKRIIKKYDKIKLEKKYRKLIDANEKKKKEKNIAKIDEIRNFAAKKPTKLAAKKVLEKYRKMQKPKKTFLVHEADLETIDYNNEPSQQEDLFADESILSAANKIFDFNKFKQEQAEALDNMRKENIDEEPFDVGDSSILAAANKVFDFAEFQKQQQDAIKEFKQNKNAQIAAAKIKDKYRKMRKKRANSEPIEQIKETFESFQQPKKQSSCQMDKAAQIAARKVLKKYKNIRFQ